MLLQQKNRIGGGDGPNPKHTPEEMSQRPDKKFGQKVSFMFAQNAESLWLVGRNDRQLQLQVGFLFVLLLLLLLLCGKYQPVASLASDQWAPAVSTNKWQ